MKCSYCRETINRNLSLKEIFVLKKISENQLCSTCQSKFELLPEDDICYGCHRISKRKYCSDCLKWQEKYPTYSFHHEALYAYNESMHEWFEDYKFRGNYLLRYCFSEEVRKYFKQKSKCLVIPLPISGKRMSERGFNQVEGILDAAGVTYQSCLIRKTDSKPQAQKTRQERLQLQQPFELTEEGKEIVRNQSIILVDDIYTTGRTIFHAAQVLLENKPQNLYTFSIAR
ncbi:ComF family protein [Enterococcus rivorum]|uniref:Amidophosphoribosyltransferase n=1 Tax=Enterococcus rivorum TaxID=762845 RepID=A0A1E5KW01_9ENTE|nr:ComF family protein [Enterococcus rivorum]MBP2100250.1 competence protein ComFC [Enterococcus rivorum]OEH82043.1 amidophosphoribosyltransferase [Enterococcus rivorum]